MNQVPLIEHLHNRIANLEDHIETLEIHNEALLQEILRLEQLLSGKQPTNNN